MKGLTNMQDNTEQLLNKLNEFTTMQDKAKYLLNRLNNDGLDKYNYIDDALDLLHEYDYETGCIMLVDDDSINSIIKNDIEDYGWQRVACFLAKIDSIEAPYGYYLNGYGNLCELNFDDIKMYLSDIANY